MWKMKNVIKTTASEFFFFVWICYRIVSAGMKYLTRSDNLVVIECKPENAKQHNTFKTTWHILNNCLPYSDRYPELSQSDNIQLFQLTLSDFKASSSHYATRQKYEMGS